MSDGVAGNQRGCTLEALTLETQLIPAGEGMREQLGKSGSGEGK